MYWKFACDDGVEKKNFEKSQIWSKHLSNPLYLICNYHPKRQLLEPTVVLPKPISMKLKWYGTNANYTKSA